MNDFNNEDGLIREKPVQSCPDGQHKYEMVPQTSENRMGGTKNYKCTVCGKEMQDYC